MRPGRIEFDLFRRPRHHANRILCLIIPFLATGAAAADISNDALDHRIDTLAASMEGDVIAWRHDLHQHPELSKQEFRTSALAAQHLESLGIEVETGAAFSAFVFGISVVTIPLLLDRKDFDVPLAVVVSFKTALQNKNGIVLWALIIALLMGVGFATLTIGFLVILPLLGHATWHSYGEMIDLPKTD